jgi:hypothetical protein
MCSNQAQSPLPSSSTPFSNNHYSTFELTFLLLLISAYERDYVCVWSTSLNSLSIQAMTSEYLTSCFHESWMVQGSKAFHV